MSLLWINGHLVDKAEAGVSPFDHGFLYGDGVWEHLRVFGGKLFRPAEHLARLFSQAGIYELEIPLSRDELTAAIEETVRANNRTDGYIRVIVSRGPGTIGPDPRKIDPQVFIIAEEYQPFPLELYAHGLHATFGPHPINTGNPACWMRPLGRPEVALAKLFALKCGCLEAVLMDTGGGVIGATEGELFYVRDGHLFPVPPATAVASMVVLELARSMIPVAVGETPNRPEDLRTADEVFLAGTACGVIGIVRLHGRDIGTGIEGPVTRALQERYRVLTRGGG
jgi:branched-chain amino acid aminotransferase